MKEIHLEIEKFFEAYERRFAEGLAGNPDVEGTTSAFANFFVEASPVGISGGKNDDAFRESVPKGYDFYKSIGTTEMKINQLDITELDDMHIMVEVYWEASYQTSETIAFNVIYFLQYRNETLKIFAYITGDEQKVLQEKGLI